VLIWMNEWMNEWTNEWMNFMNASKESRGGNRCPCLLGTPNNKKVTRLLHSLGPSWGGHWGLSETEKPAKIFTKTEKPEEKSLKTEKKRRE